MNLEEEIEVTKKKNIDNNNKIAEIRKEYRKLEEDNFQLMKQIVNKFNEKYGIDIECYKIRYVPKNIKFESEVQEGNLINFEYTIYVKYPDPGVDGWYLKLSRDGISQIKIHGSIIDVEKVKLTNKSQIYKQVYLAGFVLFINPLFVDSYKLPVKPEIPTWEEFVESKGIRNGY